MRLLNVAMLALISSVAFPVLAEPPKKPEAAKSVEKKPEAKGKDEAKKADEKGEKKDDKGDDKDKKDDKAEKNEGPKSDKAAVKAKAKEDRDALKAKLGKKLAGKPAPAALKEELKRHARRLARLERIEALAKDEKDEDAEARVKKLIDKENARHDKFMAKLESEQGAEKKGGEK